MNDCIDAINAIRNTYSHQVSLLSPSDKESLMKQYTTTDTFLQLERISQGKGNIVL